MVLEVRLRTSTAITALIRRPGRLERMGTDYGGWTIPPSALSPSSICYCVGCGEDVSFDAILAERLGCEVWSYDPTPRAAIHMESLRERTRAGRPMEINGDSSAHYEVSQAGLERWRFEPLGVWSQNETKRFYEPSDPAHVSHSIANLQGTEGYFEAECRTLASLMARNGHTHLDLLKLDVEGAEYQVIESLKRDNIRPKLLCIEFDEGGAKLDDGPRARIENALGTLKSMGYWLAHRDDWNFTFVI